MAKSLFEKIEQLKQNLESVRKGFSLSPELEQKIEELNQKIAEKRLEYRAVEQKQQAEIKSLQAKFGVTEERTNYTERVDKYPDTYTRLTLRMDGVVIYDYDGKSKPPQMLKRAEELNAYLNLKDVKKGMQLKSEILEAKAINSDSFFAKRKLESNEKKLAALLAGDNDYAKYVKQLEIFKKANEYFKAFKELRQLHTEQEADYFQKSGEQNLQTERKQLQGKKFDEQCLLEESIQKKKQMMILNFYKENLKELSLQSSGAIGTLKNELGDDAKINQFLSNFKKFEQTNEIAALLHEDWRKTRLKDGVFEPRWKEVKDQTFANQMKQRTQLPINLRKNGEKLEIDIANSTFEQLSFDWQKENLDAAGVAQEFAIKGFNKEDIGIVGHHIHEEWLKRNAWAKGGELDVPFAKLPEHEQRKDLRQYEIACEVIEKAHSNKKYVSVYRDQ